MGRDHCWTSSPPGILVPGLKELCDATGIPYGRADGIVVHSGRHTLATELLMENVTSTKVARILGNTPAVVDETCDHLMPSDVRRDHAQIMQRKLGDLDGDLAEVRKNTPQDQGLRSLR